MEMHAYDEDYLPYAQRILGDMFDFAVNSCKLDGDEFFGMFLVSGVAEQFQIGNPTYVSGRTGCELVREAMVKCGLKEPEIADEMFVDKSPEYWCGWALAFYQWYSSRSFERIHATVSFSEMLFLYPTLHEADLTKLVSVMDARWEAFYTETHLKQIRANAGLSQRELAEASGVSLRQIQLFEERQRDINKTQVLNLRKLSRALGCDIDSLLEI